MRPLHVQRKTRKAGAQHSLFRLLTHPRMLDERPILLCEGDGWLARASSQQGVSVIRVPFPRESWLGRLSGRRAFVNRVCEQLAADSIEPGLVHGNSHSEAWRVRALADRLGAPGLVTLRASPMSRRQFHRRGCDRMDLVIANGPWMRRLVADWSDRPVETIPNGLSGDEFAPPRPLPERPRQVLVLGGGAPAKGWPDLLEALARMDRRTPHAADLEFVFPDDAPDWLDEAVERLGRAGVGRGRLSFVGRQSDLRPLIDRADLAVHPSRSESFGMAALEVLAAGVPLISTRTGVVPEVVGDGRFLVEPERPAELAACLARALRDWPGLGFPHEVAQRHLRAHYSLDATVERLLGCYRRQIPG